MKILAVSDRVLDQLYCSDVKQKYANIDLLIGCGDLPFYYLDFLISALDVPLIYVLGNHDQGPQYTADGRVLTEVRGGRDIHARCVMFEGLLIAGLEGSMRYRPQAPLMYSEAEMRQQIARLVPRLLLNRQRYGRYLDILVTHSPPFGIHDRSDIAHTGFKIFNTFIKLFKPRYMLHGHIHLYRQDTPRVTLVESTKVINVYPYRVLDISKPPEPSGDD
ncbi:MAG: metallophosphoesterase [Ardenticatenaceae bacterium]|nr:metallophosphoesterase [Ardenticatenaceae bacterium]MCB9446572.1 metallophosphoesterase [Ardenticatenaceae bacterium]